MIARILEAKEEGGGNQLEVMASEAIVRTVGARQGRYIDMMT